MIDLTKLSHMRIVARYGSFVRAADALFISQPALSRSIKGLEDLYGVRLFTRHRDGVRLTAEGQEFLNQAETLLAHADAVERDLQATATGDRRVVAFGIGPMSGTMLLEQLLTGLLAEGHAAAQVRIGSNRELRTWLLNGEIEFFVGGLPRAADFARSQNLNWEMLASNILSVFVREGHPAADDPNVDLSQYPLIAGSLLRLMQPEGFLETHGLGPVLLELDDYDLLLRLAAHSAAMVVASRPLVAARSEYNLVEVVPPFGDPLELGVVTVSGRPVSKAARGFIDDFLSPAIRSSLGKVDRI